MAKRRLMSLALAVACLPAVLALPAAAGGEQLRPSFPTLDLGVRQAAGQDAVNRLGYHLPDVAAWYGRPAGKLRDQLLKDRTLRVDQSGHLLVVEEIPPVKAIAPQQGMPQSVEDGSLVPLEQTFLLHSRPGALRTIFIDFDGAAISGTSWNGGGGTLTAQPYDLDRKPTSFSAAERQRIQYIWQRVAEDYAPFDVDVTTEQPTQDRLTRSGTNDQVYGTTVVVTKMRGLMSCGCGGIAYVGVFNYPGGSRPPDFFKPAFVFYDMLASGEEKAVAEAISHEAGHNMGLQHDGTASSAYYGGQGSDPQVGWAPIMGVGYWKPLVQFSRGEYAGANNQEDDFVVAQNFGLPLRRDDNGDTIATATPFAHAAAGSTDGGSMDGIIETAGDRDVFAIPAGAGPVSIAAVPASRSANLDVALRLLDSRGAVLASADTRNALGTGLAYVAPAQGSYFLEVRGTGQDDPAGTGYSSYGSTGNYRISAAFVAPAGAAPVPSFTASPEGGAAPLAVTFDGTASRDDGRVAFWYWDFGDGRSDLSGTLTSATHSYVVPGDYTARLTVVDDSGLSASTSRIVRVGGSGPQVSVQGMQIALRKKGKGGAAAVVSLTVVNQTGQPMPKASVSASWNGVVNKSVTAVTGRSGSVTLTSPAIKTSGCFNLTVTGISLAGYTFNAATARTAQQCR